MTAKGVARIGSVLGVAGGVLRASGSFAPALIASDASRVWLYAVIDVCLTAGLLSIYGLRRHGMSAASVVGFLVALAGLLANWIIRAITQTDLYSIAAAAVAIGIVTLSLGEWRDGRMPAWIPAAFALSLVLGGVGMFVGGAGPLSIVSGILFGVAFAAMAITAFRASGFPS